MIPVYIGYCAVFKVREEARARDWQRVRKRSELPATRRSLKTQQHAAGIREQVRVADLPDSVDIPSPDALPAPVNSRFILGAGLARQNCLTGSGCPRDEDSLERR